MTENNELEAQDKAIESFGGIKAIRKRMNWLVSSKLMEIYQKGELDDLASKLSNKYLETFFQKDLIDIACGNKPLTFDMYKKLCAPLGISEYDAFALTKSDPIDNPGGLRVYLDAVRGLERKLEVLYDLERKSV